MAHSHHARIEQGYVTEQKEIVKRAFRRIDYRVLLISLYDLLFWGLSFAIVLGLVFWLAGSAQGMEFLRTGSNAMLEATAEEAASNLQAMQLFLVQFVVVIVLAIAAPLLLFVLSRHLIWLLIAEKKFSWKAYWKFLGLHALWACIITVPMIVAVAPLYALAEAARANNATMDAPLGFVILFWVIVVFVIYFTHTLYYYFMQKTLVFEALKNTLTLGFRHMPRRGMAVLIVILLMLVWWVALQVLSSALKLQPGTALANTLLVITTLITLIYYSFCKFYIYEAIRATDVHKR